MVPNGVGTGKPPAKSLAPRTVWQSAQLPVAASARPRLTSAGSNDCGDGCSIAAIAGRQITANPATDAASNTTAIRLTTTLRDAIAIRTCFRPAQGRPALIAQIVIRGFE